MDRKLCLVCQKNLARIGKNRCDRCSRSPEAMKAKLEATRFKYRASIRPWSSFKKDYCEAPGCTTTIVHSCQLDVDHNDGNKKNNDPSNLITLCASCHRLKTYLNKDWDKRKIEP